MPELGVQLPNHVGLYLSSGLLIYNSGHGKLGSLYALFHLQSFFRVKINLYDITGVCGALQGWVVMGLIVLYSAIYGGERAMALNV